MEQSKAGILYCKDRPFEFIAWDILKYIVIIKHGFYTDLSQILSSKYMLNSE